MAQANARGLRPDPGGDPRRFALAFDTESDGDRPWLPLTRRTNDESAKPWDTRANTRSWSAQATTGAASQTPTTPTTSARPRSSARQMADCGRQRRRPRPVLEFGEDAYRRPGHMVGTRGESRLSYALDALFDQWFEDAD